MLVSHRSSLPVGDRLVREETTEEETALSHMVIYRTADGQPGYHQAGELDEAVKFVERLRNTDGVDGARIFRMEEVNFDFRPYFKVEIGPGGLPVEEPVSAGYATPEPAFSTDLGFGAPEPSSRGFAPAESWAEPAVESAAALGVEEPESLATFAPPPAAADSSVIDALPAHGTVAEAPSFDPPAAVDALTDEELDGSGAGARRGLFGR